MEDELIEIFYKIPMLRVVRHQHLESGIIGLSLWLLLLHFFFCCTFLQDQLFFPLLFLILVRLAALAARISSMSSDISAIYENGKNLLLSIYHWPIYSKLLLVQANLATNKHFFIRKYESNTQMFLIFIRRFIGLLSIFLVRMLAKVMFYLNILVLVLQNPQVIYKFTNILLCFFIFILKWDSSVLFQVFIAMCTLFISNQGKSPTQIMAI